MQAHTRRAIAYIAGRLISSSRASAVYDYSESRYVNFSGDVSFQNVNVYDYDQRCYVSGSLGSLYHYGNRSYVQLDVNGTNFRGYDYDTRNNLSGNVSGSAVSLYDYGTSAYFNYSV